MAVKVVVEGNSVKVVGDTYEVKEIIKKYGLKWDKYEKKWYINTESLSAGKIRKLAQEINAELVVNPLDYFPDDVLDFIPDKAKRIISELL